MADHGARKFVRVESAKLGWKSHTENIQYVWPDQFGRAEHKAEQDKINCRARGSANFGKALHEQQRVAGEEAVSKTKPNAQIHGLTAFSVEYWVTDEAGDFGEPAHNSNGRKSSLVGPGILLPLGHQACKTHRPRPARNQFRSQNQRCKMECVIVRYVPLLQSIHFSSQIRRRRLFSYFFPRRISDRRAEFIVHHGDGRRERRRSSEQSTQLKSCQQKQVAEKD